MILIFRYVQTHYMQNLNQTPNYDYLGHPINSYHLIRHVASGWNNIMKNLKDEDTKVEDVAEDFGMFLNNSITLNGRQ